MASLQNLNKNYAKIEDIYKKMSTNFSLQKQYELMYKLYMMSLQGEKNLTIDQLKPVFDNHIYQTVDGKPGSEAILYSLEIAYKLDEIRKKFGNKKPNFKNISKNYLPKIRTLDKQFREKERIYNESFCVKPKPKDTFVDCEQMDFDGDIIITDPCYIDEFITPSMSRSTIYGDWSAGLFKIKKGNKFPKRGEKRFGDFCADSGQVCVTQLPSNKKDKNVIKLLEWVKQHYWCAHIIEDFTGTVKYVEHTKWFAYEKHWERDTSLLIYGNGTVKGKKFNFFGGQTGF